MELLTKRDQREFAEESAKLADVCLDRFIRQVERILRRDGADELVKKLDAVIPGRDPQRDPEDEVEPILLREL